MNRIEDEPIRFYLEHEAQIREWAALEAEVAKFVDRFYRSLKGDVDAALGAGKIDGVESFFHELGDWRPRCETGMEMQVGPFLGWAPGMRSQNERARLQTTFCEGAAPRISKAERLVAGLCGRRSSGWQVLGG